VTEQRFEVEVNAPAEQVWAAAVDWERQGEWMFATRVRQVADDRLRAVTGIGPAGLVDNMRITGWDPPHRCTVQHLGPVLLGEAVFEVIPAGARARFVWTEDLALPGGRAGRVALRLSTLPFGYFAKLSLRRFARFAEKYR
jgi:polyketide cyclase/dehydrase/lipid transport protein